MTYPDVPDKIVKDYPRLLWNSLEVTFEHEGKVYRHITVNKHGYVLLLDAPKRYVLLVEREIKKLEECKVIRIKDGK